MGSPMKNALTIAASIAAFLFAYGLVTTHELEEQERAEAHKQEIIAAAKKEFARRRREEWAALEAEGERLTFPVSAYAELHKGARP